MTFYIRLAAAPPTLPPEATHYMVLKLRALPFANWDGLEAALSSIVTQAFTKAVNLFGSAMGWQIVGTPVLFREGQESPAGVVPSGEGWVVIYLKKTGSPISFLAAWAIFIVVGIAIYGFVLYAWSLYEAATAKRIEAETQREVLDNIEQLYNQGAISEEEYKKILSNYEQAKPKTIFQILAELLGIPEEQARLLVMGFVGLIVFAIIVSLLK